jgi:hypothetical protein
MRRIIKFDPDQALGTGQFRLLQINSTMGPLAVLLHLLSFVAPAVAVGVLVALASRVVAPRGVRPRRWWLPFVLDSAVGVAVLVAGLWFFGRDGKMATYAALVVAVATCEWIARRGWRAA